MDIFVALLDTDVTCKACFSDVPWNSDVGPTSFPTEDKLAQQGIVFPFILLETPYIGLCCQIVYCASSKWVGAAFLHEMIVLHDLLYIFSCWIHAVP